MCAHLAPKKLLHRLQFGEVGGNTLRPGERRFYSGRDFPATRGVYRSRLGIHAIPEAVRATLAWPPSTTMVDHDADNTAGEWRWTNAIIWPKLIGILPNAGLTSPATTNSSGN
jgi:hypothetical protein